MTRRVECATAVRRLPRHRAKQISGRPCGRFGRPMPKCRGRFIAPAKTGEPEL